MEPIQEERHDRIERVPGARPGSTSPGYIDPAGAPADAQGPGYYRATSSTVVRSYNYTAERVVWFLVALVDILIAIRFLMRLMGASYDAAFVRFVYGITSPLVSPFRAIFPPAGQGNNILEPESLIALAIYALIGWGVVALIRILTAPRVRTT